MRGDASPAVVDVLVLAGRLRRRRRRLVMLLVGLHVRRQSRGRAVAPRASRALVRPLGVVRLQVDLQVIAPGEGGLTFRAAVSPVPGMQLHVTIAAALVLEQSVAPTASIRHLIAVALFVFLQVAEPRERPVAELARVRGSGIIAVGIDADVGVNLRLRRKAGRCRCRAGRRRLAAATRIGPAILAVPRGASGS